MHEIWKSKGFHEGLKLLFFEYFGPNDFYEKILKEQIFFTFLIKLHGLKVMINFKSSISFYILRFLILWNDRI